MLLDRADQAISSTDLQKNTKVLLDRMADGSQDRYVVIRDNRPMAVLLPTDRYEALMEELEDMRVDAIARERVASLKIEDTISHAEMAKRLGLDGA